LESTQAEAVDSAADLIVKALTGGGAVYCAAIGHGNEADFLNRAGGLAAVQRFSFEFRVQDPVADCHRNRPRPDTVDQDLESVRLAVRTSNLRSGDVMLIGSVSGKNRYPIELALTCRDIGVSVIGFTSLAYTAQVESLHPSGKKLCDAVDVVIDNGAPFGDAAVHVDGYDTKVLPISGVSTIVAGWLVWARVLENMAAAGTPASVFMSVNREGGREYYERSKTRYNERGY